MGRYWLFVGLVLALLLGLFAVVEALHVPLLTDPSPWLERGGPVAAALGVGLLVGDVVLPVPSSLVMVANGAVFGFALGAALSLAGSVGGTLLGFAIGRRGGPWAARLVPDEQRERAGRLLERWGALAIVVTRPLPLLADTAAVLAGASPLGWGRATVGALLGSLPGALLYALAGATAASTGSLLLAFGLAILFAGLLWLLGRWGERVSAG